MNNSYREPNVCYTWLMSYNWQQPDWPQFRYDLSALEDIFLTFAEKTGQVAGLIKGLSSDTQTETAIELMATEALKTSAIEGELLSRHDVLSSIRKNLGIGNEAQAGDKRAIGIATLMTDVRQSFLARLSQETLFEWHRMIMARRRHIQAGTWRTHAEPMQVISGPIGHETVHFEAPPSSIIPREMARFIEWFNDTGPDGTRPTKKALVRSAVAHLYFESIHPFEDGNGRVGRALSEKALSQGLKRPALLSLSRSIEAKRNDYYDALQQAQQSNEITPWITWFATIALDAQVQAEEHIDFTLRKTRLLDRFTGQLNERQMQILQRMLEEGPKGFEGGMSAKKYMSIADTSKATATRDLQDLAAKGIFVPTGGGRSTHYRINL